MIDTDTNEAGQPVRILVVDDEPDLEFLIVRKFRQKIKSGEYEFLFAHNGIEALEVLQKNRDVDMVLTDINMPEMDGLTLLLQLSHMDVLLKAVIVSAYGDMENIRTAMNRGAFDFLTKPIDFNDLELTIAKTIEEVRALRKSLHSQDRLRQLENELQVARRVQESILPHIFPETGTFRIYAEMIPAKMVGGDFYDFFALDENRFGFVVADVSGKGIPAAFFMAISRTLFKTTATLGLPTSECMFRVNRVLALENNQCMFVTAFYGVLDIRTGELEYCDAGHNTPFLLKADGEVALLERHGGIVLGIVQDTPYDSHTIQLAPGDTLFVYTDGVTEAFDPAENLFTMGRLDTLLRSETDRAPRSIVAKVFSEVSLHAAGRDQSDDITCLGIQYLGEMD